MEFRLKCEKPEEILYTVTATMTAHQWEEIREYLDKGEAPHYGPGSALRSAINDLLAQARKIYWPTPPTPSRASQGKQAEGGK